MGWPNKVGGTIALALLTAVPPACPQAPSQREIASDTLAVEQQKVVEIRVVREDGQVLPKPINLSVEIGKPLDREKVAENLRALYRTGDYANLKAVVTPEAEGVRLDFVVRENLFFNRVRIEGLVAPPSESSAAAAMQIGLGQTYRKTIVD